MDTLFDGRYEPGLIRGHGWHPPKGGVPTGETRDLYEETLEIVVQALERGASLTRGASTRWTTRRCCRPDPAPPGLPRRHERSHLRARGGEGLGVAVPPLLPYEALREQGDIYRETCAAHGHEPYIVWIHACYLDEAATPRSGRRRPGFAAFSTGTRHR